MDRSEYSSWTTGRVAGDIDEGFRMSTAVRIAEYIGDAYDAQVERAYQRAISHFAI